jgi:hypothetical protein
MRPLVVMEREVKQIFNGFSKMLALQFGQIFHERLDILFSFHAGFDDLLVSLLLNFFFSVIESDRS